MQRHLNDPYVKLAQKQNYRSRSSFKLIEIQKKYRLLRKGMQILDLGAAPGGWSQVAAEILGGSGKIIALDLLSMDPISGVDFHQGDFTDQVFMDTLCGEIDKPLDLIMSDMAPNLSGNKAIDQPRAMELIEAAFELSLEKLKPNGAFLVKLFQGEGVDQLLARTKRHFTQVKNYKPTASRTTSSEIYLLARGFKRAE